MGLYVSGHVSSTERVANLLTFQPSPGRLTGQPAARPKAHATKGRGQLLMTNKGRACRFHLPQAASFTPLAFGVRRNEGCGLRLLQRFFIIRSGSRRSDHSVGELKPFTISQLPKEGRNGQKLTKS